MWYPLADFPDGSGPGGRTYTPRIDTGPYRFVHILEDIESLNQRSAKGELEIPVNPSVPLHRGSVRDDKLRLEHGRWLRPDGRGQATLHRR